MNFNSLEYLVFLPIVFILYWAYRGTHWQNGTVLIAGCVFYSWAEPKMLMLLLSAVVSTYIAANVLNKKLINLNMGGGNSWSPYYGNAWSVRTVQVL